jgi:hypothetical protein
MTMPGRGYVARCSRIERHDGTHPKIIFGLRIKYPDFGFRHACAPQLVDRRTIEIDDRTGSRSSRSEPAHRDVPGTGLLAMATHRVRHRTTAPPARRAALTARGRAPPSIPRPEGFPPRPSCATRFGHRMTRRRTISPAAGTCRPLPDRPSRAITGVPLARRPGLPRQTDRKVIFASGSQRDAHAIMACRTALADHRLPARVGSLRAPPSPGDGLRDWASRHGARADFPPRTSRPGRFCLWFPRK